MKITKNLKNTLTEGQRRVLEEGATEPAFSGKYVREEAPGMYACAACGNELFSSKHKFDSGSGWPSFYDLSREGSVELREDNSLGMKRTEVVCSQCGSHLGHLFEDGPTALPDGRQATGKRYCINSLALDLREED